jgi:hypothetical protein
VHPERYKAPIHLEQSQGWRPNHSAYRGEACSSLRADKGVHDGAAQGDSYSHVHVDSHVEPLETSSLVVEDSDPPLKRRRFHGSLSKGTHNVNFLIFLCTALESNPFGATFAKML